DRQWYGPKLYAATGVVPNAAGVRQRDRHSGRFRLHRGGRQWIACREPVGDTADARYRGHAGAGGHFVARDGGRDAGHCVGRLWRRWPAEPAESSWWISATRRRRWARAAPIRATRARRRLRTPPSWPWAIIPMASPASTFPTSTPLRLWPRLAPLSAGGIPIS